MNEINIFEALYFRHVLSAGYAKRYDDDVFC